MHNSKETAEHFGGKKTTGVLRLSAARTRSKGRTINIPAITARGVHRTGSVRLRNGVHFAEIISRHTEPYCHGVNTIYKVLSGDSNVVLFCSACRAQVDILCGRWRTLMAELRYFGSFTSGPRPAELLLSADVCIQFPSGRRNPGGITLLNKTSLAALDGCKRAGRAGQLPIQSACTCMETSLGNYLDGYGGSIGSDRLTVFDL